MYNLSSALTNSVKALKAAQIQIFGFINGVLWR